MLPTFSDTSLVSTALLAERDGFGDGDGKGFAFLVFLLLLGTGIFFLVRAIRQRRNGPALQRIDARRMLDERFAQGDIDRAEYEHRKAVLDGADVVPPAPAAPPASPAPSGAATATMEAPTAVSDTDAPAAQNDGTPDGDGSSAGDEAR